LIYIQPLTQAFLFPQKKIIGCSPVRLYGYKTWKVTKRNTRDMPAYINRYLRKILRSGLTISPMKNCGGTRDISGSANQTAQMEAYQIYTKEEIPLPQRNKLTVPPRTTQQRLTK